MYLRRLEFRSFRPYEEATLELPETGLGLVIGPNNAGKSALLSALDVLAGRSGEGSWRHVGSDTPASVRGLFVLAEEDRRRVFAQSTTADAWLAGDGFSQVELTFSEIPDAQMAVSSVRATSHDGTLQTVASARFPASGQILSQTINLDGLLTQPPAQAQFLLGGASSMSGGAVPTTYLLQTLPSIAVLATGWKERLYHFQAMRTGTPRQTQIVAVAPQLEPNGGNLAQCLLYLFSQGDSRFDEIQRVLGDIVPGVGVLRTPARDQQVEVAFRDPTTNALRNLKDLERV